MKLFGRREKRAADPSWQAMQALAPSGSAPSARAAENLATVLACVGAISSAIASLPVWVYRRSEAGRTVDELHPLMRLVRRGAGAHQSWPDFVEWLIASTLLRGNALAEIVTDGRGGLVELRPIPWDMVTVQILPSGRLAYDVAESAGIYGASGRRRRLLEGEVLHLRDRTDDGLVGRSRLSRAAGVVAGAVALQEFAGAMFANGVHPSGVLTAEGAIGPEVMTRLKHQFREAFAGPRNAAKALVLESGLKWTSISISPEDAELLASRRFSGEELARLYQVPPPIVGDLSHGTFTNSETLIRFFAQSTLAAWCRKLEAEMARSVLSEAARATHEVEFDLSGLLRGDPETRWASHKIAVETGILTANEVREIEGFNPRANMASEP